MDRIPVHARQHPGRARRALATQPRLRALLQRPARHHHRPYSRDLRDRQAATRSRRHAGAGLVSLRDATRGRIDRSLPLRFTFDGRDYQGFAGDTLASALLANGVHLMGRSFKYHRPRGIVAAGSEEPNALVRVGSAEDRCTPNLRATCVEIYEGLVAESQNRFPSLAFDVGALNDFAAPLLPAGFYYKTFMWPVWGWHRWYEPAVRAMAGLGRAPTAPDADVYAQLYAHCDVLVVGAGPAGLAAA